MTKLQQELYDLKRGRFCNEKDCIQLREHWGYTLGYEYTIVSAGASSFDFIFTITSNEPKEYGF